MKRLPPVVKIILSFLSVILIGTFLLMLPISFKTGMNVNFVDSFFVATSAVCVTGLTPVVNIASTYSVFGKFIIALLIQIGGFRCVTIATFFFLAIGAKFGLNDRYLLKEALNQNKVSNVLKLLKSIIKITVCVELIGALINFVVFIQYYDILPAIGISLFHSISAFCNAGFDILGDNSLLNYSSNILLNINTMILIVIGGIGFIVIKDLMKNKFNFKKISIHSKIVLNMTLFLIIIGTLMIKFSMGDKINWLEALFTSVSARTAGFTTINCFALNSSSVIIIFSLMLIGASPCSTGGGIKTTTIYTMIKSMISFSRGKQTIVKNRKISEETKLKAFTLFFVAISLIFLTAILITIIEEKNNSYLRLDQILFEIVSAFATVGLSMGITPTLSIASKLIICLLMFVGRIGPITIMGMWNLNWNKPSVNNVDYLEEKIIIG